jgi:hypothetical protein
LDTFYQAPEDLVAAKLRMIKVAVPLERAVKDEEDLRAILTFTKLNLSAVKKNGEEPGYVGDFKALLEWQQSVDPFAFL